jgi:hypothetical protein
MARKSQQERFQSIMNRLSRRFRPDDILYELSVLYEEFSIAGETEAEVDYWLKLSKATANLSSGAEKWFEDMVEDKAEEEEGEEEE